MQGNENHAANPSQLSGQGQGAPPSVFVLSSKLRNKLDKLTQWRIDPSLIEFPGDAREFRGGFAIVSQAVLASPSSAKGGANEPEHTRGEGSNSDTLDAQSGSDIDRQGKGEGAGSYTEDGDNNPTKGGGRIDNDEEQGPQAPGHASITKIGDQSASSENTGSEDSESADRNSPSQRSTQEPEDDQRGKDEGEGSSIVDGKNDQRTEEERIESDSISQEQNSDHRSPKPKQIVAVKKLKIERDADLERVLGLALRESEFLVGHSHPNIVKLEGFVEDLSERKVWLIFPWEEHGNLRDFLASGEWEIPERISLIKDVTWGLEYLHWQEPPIYHGDLKSLNILVNSEYHALITDFGSARHLGLGHTGKQPKENEDKPPPATHPTAGEELITLEAIFSATASTLTLTGSGYTLRWAAPELLQEEKPCLRSDIWALGWIAYEVMTNTIPFHDVKKDAIVIKRVIQGHLPSVTEDARMSLIRALCSLMVQCWSINPEKRPTAEECRKSISWMPMIVPAPTQTITEDAPQLRHAQLLRELGHMYRRQADYLSALSSFTQALNIYTTNNDARGRAEMLRYLAEVHRFRGEHAEAVTLFSEALRISTDLGYESERFSSIFGLAEIHRLRGEYNEAAKLYSECLEIHTNTGRKTERALALWGLAEVQRNQGEYREAKKLYSEVLQIHTDVGDRRGGATALSGLADMHRFQHEYNEAIHIYSEALQIYTDVGDHQTRAITLWTLADVHRLQQEYSEARKLYSESLQVCTDIAYRQGRGTALWGLAEVHRTLHEYNEATKLYLEAMQIFTDVGDKSWRAPTLMGLAITNQVQGHSDEAISLYTEASEVWEEIGYSSRASDMLEAAADIRRSLQEPATDSAEAVKVGEDLLLTSE